MGLGRLNEFVTTDTCITNMQTITPITSIDALNTVRILWPICTATPAVHEVFHAQPSTMMDAVVGPLTGENRSNRDLRYRVVVLVPLAPVYMPGGHRRVSTAVVYS